MVISDVGILGTGLWEGETVDNDRFPRPDISASQARDPYRGRRDESGVVRIAGMAFNPVEHARTIAAIEKSFLDPYRGARRRRYFPGDLKISDAETEAARNALSASGVSASEIGAVLVQSFLSDELQPKNAALVAHNLGIRHAPAWEVESICNSALAHLSVGSSLIVSGFAKFVLCVQSACYSRVMDRSSSAAIQEGDMASAFVLGPSPGTKLASSWRTDGRLHGAIKLRWGTPGNPAPAAYLARPGDSLQNYFDPELQEQVMAEIADNARTVCGEALAELDLNVKDLDIHLPHQPMSWFSAFIDDVLHLRDGVTFDTFEEYGSINSASITTNLHHALKAGRISRGTKILFFGPAAGYRFAAASMVW